MVSDAKQNSWMNYGGAPVLLHRHNIQSTDKLNNFNDVMVAVTEVHNVYISVPMHDVVGDG